MSIAYLLQLLKIGVYLLVVIAMAAADLDSKHADVKLSSKEETSLNSITRGTNKFAIDLFRALSSKGSGNVFLSPLSAQIVLAQAYIGAKGSTADELAKLLSLPKNLNDTLTGYSALIRLLEDPVLNIANRIFVESSAKIKEDFQKKIEEHFLTSAEAVDFQNDAENVRQKINTWVEEQTKKKITDLLAPNSLSSDTRLVLINAIHFKDNWEHMFSEKRTAEKPFYVSKTNTVPVQMMSIKEDFAYKHDKNLGAKLLGMNYEGGKFRMVIILPDEIDGLAKVEAKLAKVDFAETIKFQGRPEVQVSLPKFKMEETMVLNDILTELGAGTMFSEQADLSGITDERLFVSLVVQKSFVEVNEKGTEAAAATGFLFELQSLPPPPKDFLVDHPFIFIIALKNRPLPLFIGRFTHPS